MAANNVELPLVDLSGYINPSSPEDKQRVIAEVCDACHKFGFVQVKGHGIPLDIQKDFLKALPNFFSLPREEKMKLSFLKSVGRRGYESSGDSMRDGDRLHDAKEAFYIGRESSTIEPPGFHCPNVWPELPDADFKDPVWKYYEETHRLGKIIWEILIQGLGHPANLVDAFARKPVVMMKMIRYPPFSKTLPGQFGVGPHTDFGGVTTLIQEPGKEGLEVYDEDKDEWFPVPSIEDVFVINMGDMIAQWSDHYYRSAKHRVIYKGEDARLSCATFWHGDLEATNPLNPANPGDGTVAQLLVKRFGNQFSVPKPFVDEVLASA